MVAPLAAYFLIGICISEMIIPRYDNSGQVSKPPMRNASSRKHSDQIDRS